MVLSAKGLAPFQMYNGSFKFGRLLLAKGLHNPKTESFMWPL
jgi:hypothetical protein